MAQPGPITSAQGFDRSRASPSCAGLSAGASGIQRMTALKQSEPERATRGKSPARPSALGYEYRNRADCRLVRDIPGGAAERGFQS
jgi:hypothetical protein